MDGDGENPFHLFTENRLSMMMIMEKIPFICLLKAWQYLCMVTGDLWILNKHLPSLSPLFHPTPTYSPFTLPSSSVCLPLCTNTVSLRGCFHFMIVLVLCMFFFYCVHEKTLCVCLCVCVCVYVCIAHFVLEKIVYK